jgi:transcriptional regulator with XRE-family HTH domain
MKEHKYTYRNMASKLGFRSSGTFHKWVHGKNQIKAKALEQLAEIFGVNVADFFKNGGGK